MGICSRCGKSIEFRYINGQCVPIHNDGGCIGSTRSKSNDFTGYQISKSSFCFSTNCPICKDEVYFIRYNGGSVWIDQPLGPPWYKHGCFEENKNQSQNLTDEFNLNISIDENTAEHDSIIGIVKSTYVETYRRFTDIHFETGKNDDIYLRLQHSAGFLFDKLCIFDKTKEQIWPVEQPEFTFSLYIEAEDKSIVSCPKCGVKKNINEMDDHIRLKHDYKVKCPICSKSIIPKNIFQHMKNNHKNLNNDSNHLIKCTECNSLVSPRRMYAHLNKYHQVE